jgi:hypothetical protein
VLIPVVYFPVWPCRTLALDLAFGRLVLECLGCPARLLAVSTAAAFGAVVLAIYNEAVNAWVACD